MSLHFAKPLVCPVLVGRQEYVDALSRILVQVAGGQGQVVLISGEAGIGKSRLLVEVGRLAVERGWRYLRGCCFETDRLLPYAPLLDLLHTSAGRQSLAEQSVGSAGAGLAAYLAPGAAASPAPGLPPPIDPQQERRWLFNTLSQVLLDQAASCPLLIAIEDVHWSDATSLEFLQHFSRRLAASPVLLLLTYRSDEVQPDLQRLLAAFDRERRSSEMRLLPLTPSEVGSMLSAIFDLRRPIHQEFSQQIAALSEGNPFFIEEMLKAAMAGGDLLYADLLRDSRPLQEFPIPRSVQEAIERRLDSLTPAARHVLELASVAGRRFDFTILCELLNLSEEQMLHLLKELIAAQLVVEESADRFAFRHALTRQALYAQLLARERRRLHLQTAETIERAYARSLSSWSSDLAYHFYEAESWERALDYARRAAEQARLLHAPRSAIEHLTRAIKAAEQLARQPAPALYRARGRAYETIGEFERALGDHTAGLQLARAAADRQAEWHELLDLGLLWASRDYVQVGRCYDEALGLARRMEDPACLAASLNRVGNWHVNVDLPITGCGYHQEALEIYERLGDRRGMAQTLDLLGTASWLAGRGQASADFFQRAITLFAEQGDRRSLSSSLAVYALRGAVLLGASPVADLASCEADARLALSTARAIDWRAGEAYGLLILSFHLTARGAISSALQAARAGLAIAEEIEHQLWAAHAWMNIGYIYAELLAWDEARAALERALDLARQSGSAVIGRSAGGILALMLLESGSHAQARALLDSLLGQQVLPRPLPDSPPPASPSSWHLWLARARLAIVERQPELAVQILEQLQNPDHGSGKPFNPLVRSVLAEALARLGRLDEAAAMLEEAERCLNSNGVRLSLWRVQLSLARVAQQQGRASAAARRFAAARALVEDLAGSIADPALRSHFRTAAAARFPAAPPAAQRHAAGRSGALTPREREVAALIGRGMTNRQIAAALTISEETAAVHVKRILSKLAFSSRTQVAAWAVQNGLVASAGPGD